MIKFPLCPYSIRPFPFCLLVFCRNQDLRSTNGTYVIDATTGDKTRLAPKKATLLPEEGCRVQLGGVVCKVDTYVNGANSRRVHQYGV